LKVSGQNEQWVMEQVVDRKFDIAVRRGTKVPLFRFRDKTVLATKTEQAEPKRKENKKRGWFKS
jgi:hypothetical protein